MGCIALVSKAEIVELCDIDRVFSSSESMQVFIENGGLFEDWSRKFSIVIISDKLKEDLLYLNDCKESDPYVKKWLFSEPAKDTNEWKDLYLTGQVAREWSVVSQYIVEKI